MKSQHCGLLVAVLIAIPGCRETFFWKAPTAEVVGIADGKAYVNYYPESSGFETLPSQIWEVDLADGQKRLVRDMRIDWNQALVAGYLVSTHPTEDGLTYQIVADHIATGQQRVLVSQEIGPDGPFDLEFVADETRVFHANDGQLVVYDLAQGGDPTAMDVPGGVSYIYATGAGRVLIERKVPTMPLVLYDLETEEIFDFPSQIEGYNVYGYGAILLADSVITDGLNSASQAVIEWNIDTGESRVLESGPFGAPLEGLTDPVFFPFGADDDRAYLSYISIIRGVRYDALDRATGDHALIGKVPFPEYPTARQFNGSVYWVSVRQQTLYEYDVESGETRTLPFEVNY